MFRVLAMHPLPRFVASWLSLASCAFAAEAFVRPVVSYVKPSGDGYSSSTAIGLAAGVYLGAQSEHEINLEFAYTKWDLHESYGGPLHLEGEEKFLPVLVNYRYYVRDDTAALKATRFYLGPCVGMTRTKLDFTFTGSGVRFASNDSDWVFTYGGSTGFVTKLGGRFELDLGYRYLRLDQSDYSAPGTTLKGKNSSAHVFSAGVGFRF